MGWHPAPIADRFWLKVSKGHPGDCWLWAGTVASTGYGQIGEGGKMRSTHRVSYELTNGPIPKGLFVLHRCDVRACVNPSHLFLGTSADNAADKVAKGRHVHGSSHRVSKLTETQATEIRQLHATGNYLQRELAARFGVSQVLVSRIVRRANWKEVA